MHRSGSHWQFGSGQGGVGNVCFGSKADIATSPTNVRFTPKSGHNSAAKCPLCAKSGHVRLGSWVASSWFLLWQPRLSQAELETLGRRFIRRRVKSVRHRHSKFWIDPQRRC